MMPGNFFVLNIWVGSLFSVRVSAAFQIYFRCKSNNTNELRVERFPGPQQSLGVLGRGASRQGSSSERRRFEIPMKPAPPEESRGAGRAQAGVTGQEKGLLPARVPAAAAGQFQGVGKLPGGRHSPSPAVDGLWRVWLGAAGKADPGSPALTSKLRPLGRGSEARGGVWRPPVSLVRLRSLPAALRPGSNPSAPCLSPPVRF